MGSIAMSSAISGRIFPLNNKPYVPRSLLAPPNPKAKLFSKVATATYSSSLSYNPLRFSIGNEWVVMPTMTKKSRGSGAVCYASPLTARNLQWISVISSGVLMLSKGTVIQKSFIVPLFALLAPANVVGWIKGEYGVWSAFLALLFRLFFYIPGELELPFLALLLVIVSPYQVLNLRGTQEGTIISVVIAGYLAFQHFTRLGSLQNAFNQNSIVPTIAIAVLSLVSILLLI